MARKYRLRKISSFKALEDFLEEANENNYNIISVTNNSTCCIAIYEEQGEAYEIR